MKALFKYFFFVAAAATLVISCDRRPDTYEGPTVVELSPATKTKTQSVTTISTITTDKCAYDPAAAVASYDSIKVQLVGPQRSGDVIVNYAVDASGTAVDGVNYTIAGTPGKVTIPANSSFGYIRVDFKLGLPVRAKGTGSTCATGIVATTSKTLVINLLGSNEVPASKNYKKYTLTITN